MDILGEIFDGFIEFVGLGHHIFYLANQVEDSGYVTNQIEASDLHLLLFRKMVHKRILFPFAQQENGLIEKLVRVLVTRVFQEHTTVRFRIVLATCTGSELSLWHIPLLDFE